MDVFIDDIQLEAEGTQDHVVHCLEAAAKDMRVVVHDEIKAELATAKAAVVASNNQTASRVRGRLGADGGKGVRIAQALGIDFGAGRRLTTTAKSAKQ